MSRRIQTGYRVVAPANAARLSTDDVKPAVDDFPGRLAKYIPAEIVGLYLAASRVVPKGDSDELTALWWIFIACWILTPIYLAAVTRDKEFNKGPLWVQVAISTIAFPIWVFAIGGPFASLPWYKGWLAALLLIFTTFVFGLYRPKPEA